MKTITVKAAINKDVRQVWEYWTKPEHIVNWNFATSDWHCPKAENDLKVGSKLKYHMAARDGSMTFNYEATFTQIKPKELLEYFLDDGRKVSISFKEASGVTEVIESFEAENENPIDLQKQGWQAILDNFKRYVEGE